MKSFFEVAYGNCIRQASFIYFLLPIWIIIRVCIIYFRKRNKVFSIKRELFINIFFAYILFVLSLTLFPLYITWHEYQETWASINIVPIFSTINEIIRTTSNPKIYDFMIRFWIRNIIGNILLLIPLGIMLPLLWKRFNNSKKTILFAFFLSLGIEIIQLLSGFIGNRGRSFDIDDIILNTLGASLGFILFNMIIRRILNRFEFKNKII